MTAVDSCEWVVSFLSSCVRSTLLRRFALSCGVISCAVSPVLAHADDITYGYDALSRLTSVTVAGATAYYDYDAAGNITAIRRQGALSAAVPVGNAGSLHASDAGKPSALHLSTQASSR
nr:RHS repeat domain-containing protein [Paraburkholderia sp. BL23I1N1]